MILRSNDKKCLDCDNYGVFASGYCNWCRRKHNFSIRGNINLNHGYKILSNTKMEYRKKCVYPQCTETINNGSYAIACIKHRKDAKILDNGKVLDYADIGTN